MAQVVSQAQECVSAGIRKPLGEMKMREGIEKSQIGALSSRLTATEVKIKELEAVTKKVTRKQPKV